MHPCASLRILLGLTLCSGADAAAVVSSAPALGFIAGAASVGPGSAITRGLHLDCRSQCAKGPVRILMCCWLWGGVPSFTSMQKITTISFSLYLAEAVGQPKILFQDWYRK